MCRIYNWCFVFGQRWSWSVTQNAWSGCQIIDKADVIATRQGEHFAIINLIRVWLVLSCGKMWVWISLKYAYSCMFRRVNNEHRAWNWCLLNDDYNRVLLTYIMLRILSIETCVSFEERYGIDDSLMIQTTDNLEIAITDTNIHSTELHYICWWMLLEVVSSQKHATFRSRADRTRKRLFTLPKQNHEQVRRLSRRDIIQ